MMRTVTLEWKPRECVWSRVKVRQRQSIRSCYPSFRIKRNHTLGKKDKDNECEYKQSGQLYPKPGLGWKAGWIMHKGH